MKREKTISQKSDTLRLDYKRTILVGFAFFGIMCFWEVYDYIMPLILNTRFGLNCPGGIVKRLISCSPMKNILDG